MPKKDPVRKDTPYRIPNDLLDQAGELAHRLDAIPTYRAIAGGMDRSAVVRLALLRGLAILEKEARDAEAGKVPDGR
jgi:hypothetical protein